MELLGRHVEGLAHDLVGGERAAPARLQLLDLLTQLLAAPGEVVEHPLTHLLGLGDHLAALLAAGLDQLGRLGPGLLDQPVSASARMAAAAASASAVRTERMASASSRRPLGLVAGLAQQASHVLLGLGPDLGRRRAGGVEHPGRLLAQQGGEAAPGRARRPASAFFSASCSRVRSSASRLGRGTQLVGDLEQVPLHLEGVEPRRTVVNCCSRIRSGSTAAGMLQTPSTAMVPRAARSGR